MLNVFKKSKYARVLLMLMICFLSGVGTMHAYFVVTENVSNQISIGHNSIEIVEEFDAPEDPQPGSRFTKKPTVKNIGSVPCYVRMFVEFSDNGAANQATIDFNTKDWSQKQADGYYYYNKPLPVNGVTEPLFTTVTFKADANVEEIQSFDIIVYGESVQSENHSTPMDAFKNYIS